MGTSFATPRVGVVLLQLGTPSAPTPEALRRYLGEFLWDRRVIDLPRAMWWPILHGRVLRTRPAASAKLYAKVWTSEGSPLAVTTDRQAKALADDLAASHHGVVVRVAMRYGRPSIAEVLDEFEREGVDRVLAVPLYPQYAGATTGSSLQQLYEEAGRRRTVLPLRVVPPYFDDEGYIEALAAVAKASIGATGIEFDRYLLSFHGLPKRYVTAGDPYAAQCAVTADRLTAALGLPRERVMLTFQSRFGREPWLEPYTDVTLRDCAARRERVAVMCPGFVADCLETLEEIGLTAREAFLDAGGASFHRIPCLNLHPAWTRALARLVSRELHHWAPAAVASAS
ncbi:MAG TPA: ferrochelatase [Vicinamibacterales bacterium]|nr:ferrochelatase [Vicinamibacterales bacterium]